MALIRHKAEGITYLTVGFGKLRQKTLENGEKVDSETKGAVKRKTQSGGESWALEFDAIEGTIESIFYKEDKEYGDKFEVVVQDAADLFQITFLEESRFWFDLMKRLPNVDFTKSVKINPYDFEKDGKRRVGTSLKQDDIAVDSYYHEKRDDKWINLHGYPDGKDVDWSDTDDIKLYSIKVKKFLREQFKSIIEPNFTENHEKNTTSNPSPAGETSAPTSTDNQSSAGDSDGQDDLPF